MNADSFLAPTFVDEARRRLTEGVGGVGGVFMGLEGGGFVGLLHNTQYERFARDLARQNDGPLVLTGAATLFSVQTLWNVVMARAAGLLPGGRLERLQPRLGRCGRRADAGARAPGLQGDRRAVALCRILTTLSAFFLHSFASLR